MIEIFDYCKRNKGLILIGFVVLVLGGGYFFTHQSQPAVKNELKTEAKVLDKKPQTKNTKDSKSNILVVDVQGAVKTPGVYRLQKGAIVQDALKMAGGVIAAADTKQLNQAKKLTDQMQVYVPVAGEKSGAGNSSATNGNNGSGDKKVVNINTATVEDFKSVSGIGPKKAEKIIAFREKNGEFKQLHDLTKVSGIGEKSLDSLKDQLTV